jgi:putative phage-type endonuclease
MLKLINISKEQDYQGWLNYRNEGIGASEVGTIMGLNPYKSATELFYQKVGVIPQKAIDNISMFMGNTLEPIVANLWEYFDGSDESLIENGRNKTKVKHCQELEGYITNDKYPHLFFSPDRLILDNPKKKGYTLGKSVGGVRTLKLKNTKGILEIKTISGFASKQWEGGVPPSYVIQLMTYMIGLEKEYGEIVFLEDGRKLSVYPIEYNEAIAQNIIDSTTEFWDRVTLAKQDLENVHLYEPEPDGTTAYEKFIGEKNTEVSERVIEGTEELYKKAVEHKSIVKSIDELEYQAREITNWFKNFMGDSQEISFGTQGKITWKATVKGNRLFKNSTK